MRVLTSNELELSWKEKLARTADKSAIDEERTGRMTNCKVVASENATRLLG